MPDFRLKFQLKAHQITVDEKKLHDNLVLSEITPEEAKLKINAQFDKLSGLLTEMPIDVDSFLKRKVETESGIRKLFRPYLKKHPRRKGQQIQERTFTRLINQITILKSKLTHD